MKISTKLRELVIKITGYWIFKQKDIPIGCDLINDLKSKINLPINIVFDVGANVGQTAIKFNYYFERATIYSFEPVEKTFNKLLHNTKYTPQVKSYQSALGDKVDSLSIKIHNDELSVLNSLKKEAQNNYNEQSETINVITGDIFCEENKIKEIDLLKIDTEGYELEVLNGFKNMIQKSRIKAIYCEVGFGSSNTRNTYIGDVLEFANQNNFRFYGLYEVSNLQIKKGSNYGNVLLLSNDFLNK